ncbi:MAG: ribosome assembly cofactor RimP [Bacteroidales bacterium]|nr:ribosome assembly cofactor RimP [Bacteroidales bacterium]
MIKKDEIEKLVNEKLLGTNKFLVDIKIKPVNNISIFIDSDTNITISDCVDVSRFVESSYNRDVVDFQLNVSSAGIDQAFITFRQYKKNVGKEVNILLSDETKLKGTLIEVNENFIKLKPIVSKKEKKKGINDDIIELSFNEIKETKIIISFKK